MSDLHVGDEVEVLGWLEAPHGPGNPGEFDWSEHLRDERIRAVLRVRRYGQSKARVARILRDHLRFQTGLLLRTSLMRSVTVLHNLRRAIQR